MKSSPLLASLLFLCITQWASAQTKLAFVAGVERYDKSGLTNLEFAEDDARQERHRLRPTNKKPSAMALDVSYINVGGSFYFLISVLDEFSRTIVHWELRETMKELDVELVIAKEIEKHPGVSPRIISDNGPQFIAIRRGGSRNLFVSTA